MEEVDEQETLSEDIDPEDIAWRNRQMQVFEFHDAPGTSIENAEENQKLLEELKSKSGSSEGQQLAVSGDQPLPYGGKVYAGMPVRPRDARRTQGHDQLDEEVHRSALVAKEVRGGGALQWGRYAVFQEDRLQSDHAFDLDDAGYVADIPQHNDEED